MKKKSGYGFFATATIATLAGSLAAYGTTVWLRRRSEAEAQLTDEEQLPHQPPARQQQPPPKPQKVDERDAWSAALSRGLKRLTSTPGSFVKR